MENYPPMSAIRFATHPAPPGLTGSVRELWMLEDDGAFHAGLPKPYVELVISLSGIHWWRPAPGGREHRYVDGWVTPIQQGARYARAVGRRHLIGARLEPWAAMAMFGPLPPGDGTPPPKLKQFIGSHARRLRSQLIAASGDTERFAILSAWLDAQAALRGAAGDRIFARGYGANVTALAKRMQLTPRSLRRHFASHTGLSPKSWLKLHRLDAVLRDPTLADGERGLTEVAYAHGYADQAHFSREIARFTGATPKKLRRRPKESPPHMLPLT